MKFHILPVALTLAAAASLPAAGASPYISRVHVYAPAPGQYVNEIPEYEPGDDAAAMALKCTEYLQGSPRGSMVSLGAYGGYIIFSFDHPLYNKPGDYDLKIYGNAVRSGTASDGGSAEPGIVFVSEDVNANGIPDDPWFELAGSEYRSPATLHSYSQTYFRPDPARAPNADPDPDDSAVTDRTYIRWTSSDPDAPLGWLGRNTFHNQPYWPQWVTDSTLTFSGPRLAPNAYLSGGSWVLRFLPWGYADNRPNTDDPGFNLDWAVDSLGNPVALTRVHFIKVATGISQQCGWLGETSTEIIGAEDLHPDYDHVGAVAVSEPLLRLTGVSGGAVGIIYGGDTRCRATVTDLQGRTLATPLIQPGYNRLPLSLPPGLYLLRTPTALLRLPL